MLGLRCSNGIDKNYLNLLGYDIEQNEDYNDYKSRGIILEKANKVYLDEKYYFVNNMIIVSLLPE